MNAKNILDGRVPRLRSFGYSEREARFLCLAALTGGFFLRRQYTTFIERSVGGTAAVLIEKALRLKHAVAMKGFGGSHVYHLAARPFYAAIGEENNRNRRERQPEAIRQRIMALDYVIAHPEARFLLTESEKVDYFTQERGIAHKALPTKSFGAPNITLSIHSFPDRYPIWLGDGAPGERAMANFCFVDEGLAGTSRFERYLKAYGALFHELRVANIIYVAASSRNFRPAQAAFDHFRNGRADPKARHREAYFRNRLLFEESGITAFDRAKFEEFRTQRQSLSGTETDSEFESWKRNPATENESESYANSLARLHFSTHLLEHNYDFFGTLSAA